MFFVLLTIGAVNVCLGFTLAIFLGYGPPGLSEAWEAFSRVMPPRPVLGTLPPFDTPSPAPTESATFAVATEPEAMPPLEIEETLLQELLRTSGEMATESDPAEKTG